MLSYVHSVVCCHCEHRERVARGGPKQSTTYGLLRPLGLAKTGLCSIRPNLMIRKYIFTTIAMALSFTVFAQPNVVVSIHPIHTIVTAVMQDVATPTLLVSPGASPHNYAMKPSQMQALSEADLVIWIGPELETFLIKPLAQLEPHQLLTLMDEPQFVLYPYESEDHHRDHDHHMDPHLWLDPVNMEIFAGILARKLSEMDPANAATYQSNAATLKTQLNTLNKELAITLKPIAHQPFMVFHDAYQYFEKRYDLGPIFTMTLNPEVMPSAAQILAIKEALRDYQITCLFSEPQFSPAIMQRIAAETGLNYGTLDPDGGPPGNGFSAYAGLLQQMAYMLLQCLHVEMNDETDD